jgi:hypothetical protein
MISQLRFRLKGESHGCQNQTLPKHYPDKAALLVSSEGEKTSGFCAQYALLRRRASEKYSDQHAGCLSVASFGVPGYFEKRREPAGRAWGWPFLVRFLATQKMNSPARAKSYEYK